MNRWLMLIAVAALAATASAAAAATEAQPATPPPLPPMVPPSVLEPEVPAVPPPARPSPEAEETAFVARLKEVRLIEIKHLRSADAGEFEKGRRLILDLPDATYVGALVSVLYGPNLKYRSLLLDALKEFAGRGWKPAEAYLAEMAVGDGAAANRRRAIDSLKALAPRPPTDRLLYHLAVDDVPDLRDRAAAALAALGDKRAAWLMVERLTTEEWRAVTAEVAVQSQPTSDISASSVGTPKFRKATVQAAVGGTIISQQIDLPTVDMFEVGTPAFGPTVTAVIGRERVRVQHAEMLSALRALTGRDFGYDRDAWTKWMNSPDGAKVIPPWQPLKLVAD